MINVRQSQGTFRGVCRYDHFHLTLLWGLEGSHLFFKWHIAVNRKAYEGCFVYPQYFYQLDDGFDVCRQHV